MTKVIKKKKRSYAGLFENYYAQVQTKSFEPIRDLDFDSAYGLWESETQATIDILSLKSLFNSEDWVYIPVNKYASRIAAKKLRVMKKSIVDGEVHYEPAESHSVQAILDKPNENQTYYEFMYSMVCDHTLTGNTVVWRQKNSQQLIFIPIQMVNLDFDKHNKLETYSIIRVNGFQSIGDSREILNKIPKEEIGHAKRPNPFSVYWGMSPFIPGRKSVLFNRYSSEFLNNYYIKGAQPGLVVELGEQANEKDAIRTLRSMELAHTGRKNQRRNMVLPKGAKATTSNISLADQQLKDYIDNNRETIINLLEVPKHELSIAESGSLGSEEYKTALKNFWTGPLKSVMDSIASTLQALFQQELGEEYILQFDLSDVEVLQEDEKDKALLAKELLSIFTPNEVRAKLYKAKPIEGGDKLQSSQPQSQFGPFGSTDPKPPADKPAVEVSPAPPPAEEADNKVIETDEEKAMATRAANLAAFGEFKSKDPKWWNEREEMLQQEFDKANKGIFKNFVNVMGEQVDKVLTQMLMELDDQKMVTKAYSKTKLKQDISKALNSFQEEYVNGNIKALKTTVDVGYNSMLTVPFNEPDKVKIEALKLQNAEKRRKALEERQVETFKRINETTANNIMSTIDVGVEQNKTVREIARDVANQMTDYDSLKGRAETIARTETLTASSLGQKAAMNDAAEVVPNLKKIWLNAGDDRVRDSHVGLQGEAVGHNKKFSNGLDFPRDPDGEAGEVINCRCTMLVLPADVARDMGINDLHGDVE